MLTHKIFANKTSPSVGISFFFFTKLLLSELSLTATVILYLLRIVHTFEEVLVDCFQFMFDGLLGMIFTRRLTAFILINI